VFGIRRSSQPKPTQGQLEPIIIKTNIILSKELIELKPSLSNDSAVVDNSCCLLNALKQFGGGSDKNDMLLMIKENNISFPGMKLFCGNDLENLKQFLHENQFSKQCEKFQNQLFESKIVSSLLNVSYRWKIFQFLHHE